MDCGSLPCALKQPLVHDRLHDLLKRGYKARYQRDPDVLTSLAFGVISAFTGQFVAFPMETVSRRLQVCGGVEMFRNVSVQLECGAVLSLMFSLGPPS